MGFRISVGIIALTLILMFIFIFVKAPETKFTDEELEKLEERGYEVKPSKALPLINIYHE